MLPAAPSVPPPPSRPQLLGIATSLKILFSAESCGSEVAHPGGTQGLQGAF